MELTIIIPFLNEGDEVENTLASIKATTTTDCKVILINDASTDNFNYSTVARKYDCVYVEHSRRAGVAGSRQEGVELCDTPYFLLLDAHMRFYDIGWDAVLISYLDRYPRAVICGQTRFLYKTKDGIEEDTSDSTPYAGYIDFEHKELFRVVWNKVNIESQSNIVEVPCIIGAAYACNKQYWQRLEGLSGLITYGTDEELISIKVWLEGGRCLLIKDWVAGHIYRKEFPYEVSHCDTIYNRLFTAELLLPYSIKRDLFIRMRQSGRAEFEKAYDMMRLNYPQIKQQKAYIKSISTNSIEDFLAFNNWVASLNIKK